ncbi:MAG: hypothetical protein HZA22_06525 [Nitrospirae bacterium]|nr:hypothetical protein [Nitrospirota bacterium]MBI5695377.1 hypothetical protein [Nitrospirota bacterium]
MIDKANIYRLIAVLVGVIIGYLAGTAIWLPLWVYVGRSIGCPLCRPPAWMWAVFLLIATAAMLVTARFTLRKMDGWLRKKGLLN